VTTPQTIASAAQALRAGGITATELAQASIAIADALDDKVGIYIHRFDQQLLTGAAAADEAFAKGDDPGPLAGIPLGIKDIISTTGATTTGQSVVMDPQWGIDTGDAVVITRLREAGGLISGKLTTMEFASGAPDESKPFPICRNPWDLERWPGGSSSGTASGVITGAILGGLGTDTGGSIRMPAAYSGITGLMPSIGRVPKAGCLPLGYSLDHIGPMARSAEDCAIMLNALAGYDASDPACFDEPTEDYTAGLTGDLSGVTIGIDLTSGRANAADVLDPALDGLLESAIAVLKERGANVVEVEIPLYDEAMLAQKAIGAGEPGAYHRVDAQTQYENYTYGFRQRLATGTFFSAADYVQGQRVRRVVVKRVNAEVFTQVDMVLTPTAFRPALELAVFKTGDTRKWMGSGNTSYWNLTGHPVIAVPMGFNADGLPMSFQLAGRPFAEASILKAAHAYQQDTDFHLAVPAIAQI
jgi:aspartyl-tRNA(Asn)/glutamyl-tRNA(Gln) amidotransferase subunit A